MNYGAFRPRRPGLPRPPGYCPTRTGYPTIPMEPIPVIEGQWVDHRPYPSRTAPDLPRVTQSPIECPPGSGWIESNRACVPGYSGLGQYLSPGVAQKWEWDSFGVGLGAMAGTMGLGMIASLIIQGDKTRTDLSLVPALLPGIGAGIIAYLLRWHTNNCVCETPAPERPVQQQIPQPAQRTPRASVVTEEYESDFI